MKKISLIITTKNPQLQAGWYTEGAEVILATGSTDLVADKNRAAAKAAGDVLVFMDDDARAVNMFFLTSISHCFKYYNIDLLTARITTENISPFDVVCSQDLGYGFKVFDINDVSLNWRLIKRMVKSLFHKGQLRGSAPPPWGIGNGTCFAITKAMFNLVGGFNPRRTVGATSSACEDNDLFYRVLRAGGRIVYNSEIEVVHEHGRTTLASAVARRREYDRGNLRFAASHWRNPLFWPYVVYFTIKSIQPGSKIEKFIQ